MLFGNWFYENFLELGIVKISQKKLKTFSSLHSLHCISFIWKMKKNYFINIIS